VNRTGSTGAAAPINPGVVLIHTPYSGGRSRHPRQEPAPAGAAPGQEPTTAHASPRSQRDPQSLTCLTAFAAGRRGWLRARPCRIGPRSRWIRGGSGRIWPLPFGGAAARPWAACVLARDPWRAFLLPPPLPRAGQRVVARLEEARAAHSHIHRPLSSLRSARAGPSRPVPLRTRGLAAGGTPSCCALRYRGPRPPRTRLRSASPCRRCRGWRVRRTPRVASTSSMLLTRVCRRCAYAGLARVCGQPAARGGPARAGTSRRPPRPPAAGPQTRSTPSPASMGRGSQTRTFWSTIGSRRWSCGCSC